MSHDQAADLFSELPASNWWNDQSQFRTLHALNPARLHFTREILPARDKPEVLDAGCGGGILSMALARDGYNVTGVDSSANAIKAAIDQARLEQLHDTTSFIHGDISQFCQDNDKKYDMVCCMELLEHVADPAKVISSLAAQLRPGGHLVLSTLNRSISSYCSNILLAEYVLRLLPAGTHNWQYFITPAEISSMLTNANCEVQAINGIRFIPLLWRSILVTPPGNHYMVHARLKA